MRLCVDRWSVACGELVPAFRDASGLDRFTVWRHSGRMDSIYRQRFVSRDRARAERAFSRIAHALRQGTVVLVDGRGEVLRLVTAQRARASAPHELARRCAEIHADAVRDLGPELGGGSPLDLVADHLTTVPLDELEAALRLAGIRR